jgi:hypothetical protein
VQRCEDTVRSIDARQDVSNRYSYPLRIVRVRSRHRHQSGFALRDLVIAGPAAFRAVVAEATDRQHHQSRVQSQQRLIRETKPG